MKWKTLLPAVRPRAKPRNQLPKDCSSWWRNDLHAVCFLLPSLTGTALFLLLPLLDAVRRSLFTAMGGRFTGLGAYRRVLENGAFRLAAGNTLRFTVICIPLLMVLSLALALAVFSAADRAGLLKTGFLLPLAVPAASMVAVWQLLFGRAGIVNTLTGGNMDWFASSATFWLLVATYLWKNTGYNMVLWLAGLYDIPTACFEAAEVDGANAWQRLWRITLPCLRPHLFTVAVLSLVNSFKVFREAYLLGGNYPYEEIYLLQHLWGNWFITLDIDRLCAAATLLALVLFGTVGILRLGHAGGGGVKGRFSLLFLPVAAVVWVPLLMLAFGALTGAEEWAGILKGGSLRPLLPPAWPTLAPLVEILLDTPEFFHMFWNSCRITAPAILGQVLVGAPAAWALARIPFHGRRVLTMLYIALMLLPFQVTMVSSYLVLDRLSLIDTRWAVILPGVFSPFAVFIMLRGFAGISKSILESARIDGAGPLRVFLSVGLPLGVPGILSAVVLGALEQWSALEQPMTFFHDKALWPLSLFLAPLTAGTAGPGFAAALLIAMPPLLVFLYGQHDLERGIASAGLKE